jgi:redox-sensitive bicupin YhaK (pirin superfamily)
LQQILSPNPDDEGVWIHQNAWFHLGSLSKNTIVNYNLKLEGNGVYVFVIGGDIMVNEQQLNTRDGLGLWEISTLELKAVSEHVEVLLMEVPMELK